MKLAEWKITFERYNYGPNRAKEEVEACQELERLFRQVQKYIEKRADANLIVKFKS